MNDSFEKRLGALAATGWVVLAINLLFIVFLWGIYLIFMKIQPGWVLSFCGPNVSWSFLQEMMLWIIAACKVCFWHLALLVIWLSLWARRLQH